MIIVFSCSDKDAHRTDRKIKYFEGENNENIQKLTRILMTYCMYNFDLGKNNFSVCLRN